MNKITLRVKQHNDIKELIGCVLNNNCFPTMKGKMIYIKDDRCYFKIIENHQFPKYNHCAGQIEYLPAYMVASMDFKEDKEN